MHKSVFFQIAHENNLSTEIAERILVKITGQNKESLFLTKDIHPSVLYDFQHYILEFKKGKPEAYIFGEQDFYGRSFFVDTCTLIPRKDTELLVDVLRSICLKNADMKVSSYIDVGTGSACILLSLILELEPLHFSHVYASDISQDILSLAKRNIEKYQCNVSSLLCASLLDGFLTSESFIDDNLYISANLPYIRKGDYENIGKNVLDYEPASALYGGENTGFELYEKLIMQCFVLKKTKKLKKIHLVIEIGYDQYDYAFKFLSELGLRFEFFKDMDSIERIIHIHGF